MIPFTEPLSAKIGDTRLRSSQGKISLILSPLALFFSAQTQTWTRRIEIGRHLKLLLCSLTLPNLFLITRSGIYHRKPKTIRRPSLRWWDSASAILAPPPSFRYVSFPQPNSFCFGSLACTCQIIIPPLPPSPASHFVAIIMFVPLSAPPSFLPAACFSPSATSPPPRVLRHESALPAVQPTCAAASHGGVTILVHASLARAPRVQFLLILLALVCPFP